MSDQTTLDAPAFTALGTQRDRVALPAAPFDGVVNAPVMHQAVKAYLANQRQATAYTKTRGLVTGGNQKPWKQKGTGRARQGSIRAPNWPGGGTVFGPHGDRNYSEKVPRQVRALARKSAFNARALSGAVVLVDKFNYEKPKTALLVAALERIGVANRKVLLLTDGVNPVVILSARNLPNVHVMPYSDVSTYDLLWSDVIVIESSALGQSLAPIAERGALPKPARKRATARPRAAEGEEAADVTAADKAPRKARPATRSANAVKGAAKSARKDAAKKSAAKRAKAASAAPKPAAKKAAARKSASSTKKKGGK